MLLQYFHDFAINQIKIYDDVHCIFLMTITNCESVKDIVVLQRQKGQDHMNNNPEAYFYKTNFRVTILIFSYQHVVYVVVIQAVVCATPVLQLLGRP